MTTVVPDVGVLNIIAEPEAKFTAWAKMFHQEFATDAHRTKAMTAFLANDKIIATQCKERHDLHARTQPVLRIDWRGIQGIVFVEPHAQAHRLAHRRLRCG